MVAEFKVSMHCNACERSVAKTIAKIKGYPPLLSFYEFLSTVRTIRTPMIHSHSISEGVEKFKTDMNRHVVEVTGTIDPEKVSRKLKKKTGKRVEVLGKKKVGGDAKKDVADAGEVDSGSGSVVAACEQTVDARPEFGDCCVEKEMLVMFSDENPNACCTM